MNLIKNAENVYLDIILKKTLIIAIMKQEKDFIIIQIRIFFLNVMIFVKLASQREIIINTIVLLVSKIVYYIILLIVLNAKN